MALRVSFGMLWCVSCPALADYGVSHALPWYPLAGSGMSQCYPLGVLWLALAGSGCALGILLVILWLALAGSGCALVCLMVCYALMMSCVKIDHALTLHFGYCLFM